MEIAFIIIVVAYSVYRTWVNALFPLVFILFINIVEFWIKVRIEFFYSHANILDFFTIFLVALAVARHCRSVFTNGLIFYRAELALIFLIVYSWITMTWNTGIYWDINPGLIYKTIINQVLMFLCIPLLLKINLHKHDLEKDFILVGVIVAPMVAYSTNWGVRGQEFLFTVIDSSNGKLVEKASNALQLSYFACVVILFNIFYLKNRLASIISFAIAVPTAAYLLIESQTRGQILALMIAVLVFVPFTYRNFRTIHYFYIAPVVLFAIAFVAPNFGEILTYSLNVLGFEDYYTRRYDSELMSLDYGKRIRRATDAITVWQSSWSGMLVGLGTASSTSERVAGDYIHIVSLEILIEQGIIGALLYLYALTSVFSSIYNMLNINGLTSSDRSMAIFFSSMFLMTFIISFKQGALYGSHEFIMNALLVIILNKHLQCSYAPFWRYEMADDQGDALLDTGAARA